MDAGAPHGILKVLVVDDNEDMATSVVELLSSLGCSAKCAFERTSALQLFSEFTPGLVVLDLEMPGADGVELLSQMRSLLVPKQPKYVCLTGTTDPDAESRCLLAGFDRFLTKPVTMATLAELTNQAVGAAPA